MWSVRELRDDGYSYASACYVMFGAILVSIDAPIATTAGELQGPSCFASSLIRSRVVTETESGKQSSRLRLAVVNVANSWEANFAAKSIHSDKEYLFVEFATECSKQSRTDACPTALHCHRSALGYVPHVPDHLLRRALKTRQWHL